MDAREIAQLFHDAADDLPVELARAERENLADVLETAREYSAGTLTPQAAAQADHPYARRHGSPRLNPAIINRDTGGFAGAWQGEEPQATDDEITTAAVNVAPQAEFLDKGTRTMFARPLPEAVLEEVAPRAEQRRERALERVFGG